MIWARVVNLMVHLQWKHLLLAVVYVAAIVLIKGTSAVLQAANVNASILYKRLTRVK